MRLVRAQTSNQTDAIWSYRPRVAESLDPEAVDQRQREAVGEMEPFAAVPASNALERCQIRGTRMDGSTMYKGRGLLPAAPHPVLTVLESRRCPYGDDRVLSPEKLVSGESDVRVHSRSERRIARVRSPVNPVALIGAQAGEQASDRRTRNPWSAIRPDRGACSTPQLAERSAQAVRSSLMTNLRSASIAPIPRNKRKDGSTGHG